MPEKVMDIRSLTIDELKSRMEELGEKAFRAKQVYEWLHAKCAMSYDEMTNLSVGLRKKLEDAMPLDPFEIAVKSVSEHDGTSKYLFRLADGNCIESVLMPYHHGFSVCISSQIGCNMGCRFCASTIEGCKRDLTSGEMLGQIYAITRDMGERVSNVVVMGMGEPFDNYDNLVRFIRMVSDQDGLNISQRNLTVSTCGLVKRIDRFADEGFTVTLAISLHAPNDEIRKQIMPVAEHISIDELLAASRRYFEKTGRRMSFEYSLIEGVNDSLECANELAERLSGMNCHVNLIGINPVRERKYRRTRRAEIEAFKNTLEKKKINVTIRREMGTDIDAACGQLRRRYEREGKNE